MTVEGFAPAKINLALHVTGRRDDGYHLLDSLVVFGKQTDKITICAAETLSLQVTGPFAKGVPTDGDNLVVKAAELLRRKRRIIAGASIFLEKNLPHGGGIGGGSSDAATALRLLAEFWKVEPLRTTEALTLGADLPVCMHAPEPCFMRGVGEIVELAPTLPEFWLVLVNPGVPVPTRTVFELHDKLYDFSPLGLEPLPDLNDVEKMETWLLGQRNDLTKVASEYALAPMISTVLQAIREQMKSTCADMSGSGSTCWGYFKTDDAAHSAAATIAEQNPDWWVQTTRIGG